MTSEGPVAPGLPRPASDATSRRLDSWKEIAGYLGRSVRAVQRWEKEEGLPVYRHAHSQRDSVWALCGEVDAWRARRANGSNGGAKEVVRDPKEAVRLLPTRLGQWSPRSRRPPTRGRTEGSIPSLLHGARFRAEAACYCWQP